MFFGHFQITTSELFLPHVLPIHYEVSQMYSDADSNLVRVDNTSS